MSKSEFVTAHRLPKGSVWRVKAELVGGTRLEGLPEPTDTQPRVRTLMLSRPSKGSEIAVRQSGR
jgi:hypothetical protein